MSWHRDANGLWCACFITYQPDTDPNGGCPAHDCPEQPMPADWLTTQPRNR